MTGHFLLGGLKMVREKVATACKWPQAVCQATQLMVIEEEKPITGDGNVMFRFGKRRDGHCWSAIAALLIGGAAIGCASRTKPITEQAAKSRLRSGDKKPHRLVLQVNTNEPAMMNLALNNATNVAQYYKDLGEKVEIEIVTFGPGLHMLRDDTSPVKARIKSIAKSTPSISFKACGNTQENMGKAEEQGYSADLRGEGREVRRRAGHGTAGAGLDLCQALTRPYRHGKSRGGTCHCRRAGALIE